MRQAPHTWDAVGRSRPRRCATPTGTGDRSHLFAEPILWRVRVAPDRRNARKVVGVNVALKVRAIPSGNRVSDWRAQAIKSRVGLACAGPEMAVRRYLFTQPWYIMITTTQKKRRNRNHRVACHWLLTLFFFVTCLLKKPDIVRIDRLRALS